MCDRDAVQQMIERLLADCRIGIAQGSEFVFLTLKKVGVDRPCGHSAFTGQLLYLGHVFESIRQIPKGVQGDRRAAPVNWLTMPASLNFSARLVAAAGCINLPNRVPVLAKPHEGNSILN